ncbi:MAG: Gfo/Idh/MocA family oxidoreductase [Planctomycetes bacterium]|nr:Gfo/Idh/MocA family oxidoreductase [Planctomycetota bacterium]
MNINNESPRGIHINRRDVIAAGAGLAATAALGGIGSGAHVQGSDILKVGLVGCGGRGTGAAGQALTADRGARLYAMADVFPDRIEGSYNELIKNEHIAGQLDCPPERRFTGFEGYKKLIEVCDVVLLCSTPHFRPIHLRAAVEAGKQIFCEKPCAVDAPGIRSVLESAEIARKKKINLVSGFCWRYHEPDREVFGRIHDGQIGKITALHTRYLTGGLGLRARQPEWSDMEYQIRNWYYYTWLSGDHIVEQAVHSINKIAWAMKDVMPIAATAVGGRQVRTGPEFGHVFDHFGVVYEYADGVRAFHDCRQIEGCFNDNTDFVIGTKGTAFINSWGPTLVIEGEKKWHWEAGRVDDKPVPVRDMYQVEHDELFASIRKGGAMNDGVWLANSCMMAILGRMAAYTGKRITWEQAMNSKEDLSPPKYEFGPLAVPSVALPGRTPFV